MRRFTAGAAFALLAACGQSSGDGEASAPPAETIGVAIGEADAPIHMVEYASVTCPACLAWHRRVYPDLKRDYIDTGKVRFEFREFPTAPAQIAYAGFHLARCSAENGGPKAYFAMIDALFRAQQDIITGNPAQELRQIALQGGLNEEAFVSCLENEEVRADIERAIEEGRKDNIGGTPSFFINGEATNSARSIDDLRALLDAELAEADAR